MTLPASSLHQPLEQLVAALEEQQRTRMGRAPALNPVVHARWVAAPGFDRP